MSTESPLNPPTAAARIRSALAGAPRPAAPTRAGGPDVSFRALLDGLSAQARELEAGANNVESPRELAGAVERSRHATRDAAELAEGLLEAFRQSRQVVGRGAPRADRP